MQKFLFILVLLVILGSIGLWYLNEDIMPTKGKALIIDNLVKATGREVTLESVYFNPFRGIVIKNLTISDDPKYKRKFLEVEKLYLNILYIPLLKEKKLVVSSVRIDSPKIVITVDDRNKWNFGSLAFLNQQKPAEQMNVLVNSVIISKADIFFEDLATTPAFKKELKDTDFQASLSYPLKIKFRADSELKIAQKNSLSADGQFDPIKKSATLNLKIKNIPLAEFQPYYSGLPFKSLIGTLNGNLSASYSQDNNLTVATVSSVSGLDLIRADFTAKGGLDLSGKMTVDLKDKTKAKMPCVVNAAAKLGKLDLTAQHFAVKGDVDANGKFTFDMKDKTVPLKYTADTQLRDTKLSGVPVFGAIDMINGKIYFDETKLWTDMLKGLAKGFNCVFSGSIKDYANPVLNVTAKTELDLARLNELLTPEQQKKLKGYTLSGITKVSLNASGLLKQQDKTPLSYVITSELLDCGVKPDFLATPVKSINGNLTIKPDSMALRNISAFFNDKKYLLSGDITNFKTPSCDLALNSDELKLKAVFKMLDNSIVFNKFDGRYKNTIFNLAGIYADFKDPDLDIKGTIQTNLSELMPYLPKENSGLLDKFDPAASVSTGFAFKGKSKKNETWDLSLDKFNARSKAIDLSAFGTIVNFKDPQLDLRGSLSTTIDELKKYLPKEQAEMLIKNEVAGDIASKFVLKGRQKDRDTWQISLIADSPVLIIKKLKFETWHMEGGFKNNYATISRMTASPYDGTLAANAVMDMSKKESQYVVQVAVRDIDLSVLKNDTPMKDKKISGRFSANADLSGFASDISTMKGSGKFQISNGSFWELPVFSGLANILYIPGVSTIVFGQAQGTFTVANKRVYTDDVQLSSKQMNLIGNGNVDFDGNLDFQVTAAFDKSLLQVASPLGPLRDLFIDKEGNYLGDIDVNGTTAKPEYKVNPVPINKIFQNKLLDNIKKGIFGGGE